jgi:hypothetical protein
MTVMRLADINSAILTVLGAFLIADKVQELWTHQSIIIFNYALLGLQPIDRWFSHLLWGILFVCLGVGYFLYHGSPDTS